MLVVPNYQSEDCSKEIQDIANSAQPFETISFEPGNYYIKNRITFKNKKNIKIVGNNTTFISFFNPELNYDNYNGVFEFIDCENIIIEIFSFDTSSPSNSSGQIVSVDEKNYTVDVRMYEGNELNGHQPIRAINSIDAEGTPDYLLATCAHCDYTVLEDSLIRVHIPLKSRIKEIPIGEQICFRHALGNYLTLSNATLTFKNCSDVILKDINVYSSVGYMTVIFPRCNNFTFIRYNVIPKQNSHHLMASNIDAIHILGLTGNLNVTDCCFDGLGDDALNIHSTAGYINNVGNGFFAVENKRFGIPLEKEWCIKGDTVNVYDSNFLYKGNLIVDKYDGNCIKHTGCDFKIEKGDFVANTAFFARTTISNCEIRNSRARAFLLQTENITIKKCKFYGIALSAVLLSPDIRKWFEMGPVRNVTIENCRFEKCAKVGSDSGNSAICVKTSHDINENNPNIIHHNVKILNNEFVDCGRIISIGSADGVTIKENSYFNNLKEYKVEKGDYICFNNCKNCAVDYAENLYEILQDIFGYA